MNFKKVIVALSLILSPLALAQAVRVYEGKHVAAPLGTAGAPTYSFVGDANTGLFSSGADVVNMSTGGTERARFGSGGLSLGSTLIAPADELHIRDTSPAIRIENSGASGGTWRIGEGIGTDKRLSFRATSDRATDTLTLDALNDRVGIGTINPTNRLHVQGADGATAARIADSAADSTPQAFLQNDAGLWILRNDGGNSDAFTLRHDFGTPATVAVFTKTNDVGIGATSPNANLHVNNASPELPASSGTITSLTGALAVQEQNTVLAIGAEGTAGNVWLQGHNINDLGAERAIQLNPNGGNVGIALPAGTAPLQPLHVNGVIKSEAKVYTSDGSYTTTAGTDNIGLTLPNSSWWIVSLHNASTAGSSMIVAFCHAPNLRTFSTIGGGSFGFTIQFDTAPSCALQTTAGPAGQTINWSAIRLH